MRLFSNSFLFEAKAAATEWKSYDFDSENGMTNLATELLSACSSDGGEGDGTAEGDDDHFEARVRLMANAAYKFLSNSLALPMKMHAVHAEVVEGVFSHFKTRKLQ